MPIGNPLVDQGSLNRLRASVVWTNTPTLNVTAAYLGRMGVSLALEGASTLFLPTMTGVVTSLEPYMMITITIHLLKTQQLASLYKAAMETNSLIGDGTVRPDVQSGILAPYLVANCAVEAVRELSFSGDNADFAVTVRGFYLLNSAAWN